MQQKAKTAFEYVVNSDGWVAGCRRKKGDIVDLTKGQAKYEDVTLKSEDKPVAESKAAAPRKGKAT